MTPPGFRLIPEVITPNEERLLIALCVSSLDHTPHEKVERYGTERNRVIRFGYINHPGAILGQDIPKWLDIVRSVFPKYGIADTFNSIGVMEYVEGGHMHRHIDPDYFDDLIVILNLGSGCDFTFGHDDHPDYTFKAEPRGLTVMSGESRWKWTHSVSVVTNPPRYSIVFRTRKL